MQYNQMAQTAIEENTFAFGKQDAQSKDQLEIERLWKTHWLTDYAQDIFVNMKEAEMRRRPIFFNSMELEERASLLQLCQLAARTYKLNRATVHLGVYYMDRLTDYFTIRTDKLPLLALTCLHIAAQMENTDASVPRYSELNSLMQDGYTVFEYKVVERKVLSYLNFELMRPTTASFVEFFACSFLTRADYANYTAMLQDRAGGEDVQYVQYESYEGMLSALSQLLLRLADCTLSINSFANTRPSLLAAACIAAVRHLNGLKCWTKYLTKLTSYSENVVEPLLGNITHYYHWYQESYVEPYGVMAFVDMGPSSADSINPNWSTPDSGIGESVVIVEELLTVEYDIGTVQLQQQQQQPVASSNLAAVAQTVLPQEAAIFSQREPQQQAALAHEELPASALVAIEKPQESIAVAMEELQCAFKRKHIEDDCQDEPQAKRLQW